MGPVVHRHARPRDTAQRYAAIPLEGWGRTPGRGPP